MRRTINLAGRGQKTPPDEAAGGVDATCELSGELCQNVVGIRVLAGFLLGVENTLSDGDFVDSATTGDERHFGDLVGVVVKNLFRQTGGFSQIASRGAELDGDLLFVSHCGSLPFFRGHSAAFSGMHRCRRTDRVASSGEGYTSRFNVYGASSGVDHPDLSSFDSAQDDKSTQVFLIGRWRR